MTIKQISTDKLIPYENNPRNNEGAVDAVAASIKEFGFKVPIIVDKDMVVVAGHTRLKAAKKLGLDKVPCIIADDLTDEQIKAFRLADNKTAELAEWDVEMLTLELNELDDLGVDMSGFGFEDITDEIPEELDADDETDGKTVIRLVFESFSDYKANEQEIKEFAENIGASMTIGK